MSGRSRNDLDYSGRGGLADVTGSFAGVLLLVSGAFDVLQGVAAIANDNLYGDTIDYTFDLDPTVWGTVHLIVGALSIVIGLGVLRRATWGQIAGIAIAVLAIVSNFAALPIYPWWSLTLILFYLLVIWALSVQKRNYR